MRLWRGRLIKMTSSKHYPSPYLTHILVNNYNTTYKCTTLHKKGTVGILCLTRIVPFRYGEFAGTLSHKISAEDPSEIEECNNDKLLKNRKTDPKNVFESKYLLRRISLLTRQIINLPLPIPFLPSCRFLFFPIFFLFLQLLFLKNSKRKQTSNTLNRF